MEGTVNAGKNAGRMTIESGVCEKPNLRCLLSFGRREAGYYRQGLADDHHVSHEAAADRTCGSTYLDLFAKAVELNQGFSSPTGDTTLHGYIIGHHCFSN